MKIFSSSLWSWTLLQNHLVTAKTSLPNTYCSLAWGTEETEEQRIRPRGFARGDKTHLFLCGEKAQYFYCCTGSRVIFFFLGPESCSLTLATTFGAMYGSVWMPTFRPESWLITPRLGLDEHLICQQCSCCLARAPTAPTSACRTAAVPAGQGFFSL